MIKTDLARISSGQQIKSGDKNYGETNLSTY